jgi:hypothetical protein
MSWDDIAKLSKKELYRVSVLYSNYVNEFGERRMGDGCWPVCLAEFYENEYQNLLQMEEAGLYNPDTWEWFPEYDEANPLQDNKLIYQSKEWWKP